MIYSMTGYGKSSSVINGKKIVIEIRTLNSKSLDLNLKYPPLYREKESDLRNLVAEKLDRGKVDFWMNVEDMGESSAYVINKALVMGYYRQIREIMHELDDHETDIMGLVFKMPEVVKAADESVDEAEWIQIRKIIVEALEKVSEFRRSEGEALTKALVSHVDAIENYLEKVVPFEGNRAVKLREKLLRSLHEMVTDEAIDKNRFEQELIYYLEKYDIHEEKVRLKNHCDYFRETLHGSGFNGKKLNFIGQEMGREINTLGSKAYDADIQRLVVYMKDDLEKIKEQVLNVL